MTSTDGLATLTVAAGATSVTTQVTIAAETSPSVDARLMSLVYRIASRDPIQFAPGGAVLAITLDPGKRPDGAAAADVALAERDGTGALTPKTSTLANGAVQATVVGVGSLAAVWNPIGPCASLEQRQFDFWLGHWRFDSQGQPAGDEVVADYGQGCGIRETFAQGTYRGSSVSLWSGADQKWHQTYVDSEGARRSLVGVVEAGRMVLYETPSQRFTWAVAAGNSGVVEFNGEELTNGSWRVFFASTYTKLP